MFVIGSMVQKYMKQKAFQYSEVQFILGIGYMRAPQSPCGQTD